MAACWNSCSGTKQRFSWPRARRLISGISTAVFVLLQVAARPEIEPPETALEVLKSSLASAPRATYSGEKTLWWADRDGNRHQSACRVWQGADGRSRSDYVDGTGKLVRIVQREGDRRYVWSAGEDYWSEQAANGEEGTGWRNIDLIAGNYGLTRHDTQCLQRPCIMVDAISTAKGRPTLKAVIDAASYTTLVLEVTSALSGGYGYRFDSISFEAFDEAVFKIPEGVEIRTGGAAGAGRREFAEVSQAKGSVAFGVMEAGRPPAGFSLVECILEEGRLRLTYGDGLSTISVYLEKAPPDLRERGDGLLALTEVKRDGRTVVWTQRPRSTILTTFAGTTKATVIGEIPVEELVDMCFSLAPVE